MYEKKRKSAIVNISVIPTTHTASTIVVFEDADDGASNYDGNQEDNDTNNIGDTIFSTVTSKELIKSHKTLRQRYRAKKVELQIKDVELQTKEAELNAHISTIEDLREQIDIFRHDTCRVKKEGQNIHDDDNNIYIKSCDNVKNWDGG